MLNPPELQFARRPVQGPPRIKFDPRAVDAAAELYGFNCGPAAICAIAGLTPDQVLPHLGDFESKGYTNPTLMYAALRSLGVTWKLSIRQPEPKNEDEAAQDWPRFGVVRIQWGGPWTKPGVPMRARYRKTHWVASWWWPEPRDGTRYVFDVNAACVGGWVPLKVWTDQVVPWLLKEVEPHWDGRWWPTHCLECDVSGVKPCP